MAGTISGGANECMAGTVLGGEPGARTHCRLDPRTAARKFGTPGTGRVRIRFALMHVLFVNVPPPSKAKFPRPYIHTYIHTYNKLLHTSDRRILFSSYRRGAARAQGRARPSSLITM